METKYPPGKHLLLDFWGCHGLTDIAHIRSALEAAAQACGATILEIKLHSFGDGEGITGIAILAESHISIHTWPENSYAALDVFMCGTCHPEKSIDVLQQYFLPKETKVIEYERGKP